MHHPLEEVCLSVLRTYICLLSETDLLLFLLLFSVGGWRCTSLLLLLVSTICSVRPDYLRCSRRCRFGFSYDHHHSLLLVARYQLSLSSSLFSWLDSPEVSRQTLCKVFFLHRCFSFFFFRSFFYSVRLSDSRCTCVHTRVLLLCPGLVYPI